MDRSMCELYIYLRALEFPRRCVFVRVNAFARISRGRRERRRRRSIMHALHTHHPKRGDAQPGSFAFVFSRRDYLASGNNR